MTGDADRLLGQWAAEWLREVDQATEWVRDRAVAFHVDPDAAVRWVVELTRGTSLSAVEACEYVVGCMAAAYLDRGDRG